MVNASDANRVPRVTPFIASTPSRSGWRRAVGVLAVFTWAWGAAAEVSAEAPEMDEPIVIAASEVFYPYSYRDDDGQLKGFAVDITDAVARAKALRIERVTLGNAALGDALRGGKVEVIQFWSETPARREWAAFSVPIVTFETIIVVRRDEPRIRTPADLAGKVVAIGQPGTVGARYLRENHPTATAAEDPTTEEFLRKVSAGTYDAAVLSRLTAVSMIERFGLRNLRVLDAPIPGHDYDVRYCFAVRREDVALLGHLNEGLAIIRTTGEFDAIFQRWFGRHVGRHYTRTEVLAYVSAALLLALMTAMWGLLRQRSLLRRIHGQSDQLAEQRSLLAALHERHPLATLIFALAPGQAPLLVSINPEAARLLRLPPATGPGTGLDQLQLAPDLAALMHEALARGKTRETPETWESRLPGSRQLLETTVVSLGHAGASGHRVCVLLADITHRRLADEELSHSRRLRALGELVGGIAHEFNNLLTPIIGTTNLLRTERRDDAPLQGDLALVDQAARRAADLTRRLLTFGRRTEEHPAAVRLADAVQSCFDMLKPTVDRRVQWHAAVPADLPKPAINPVDLNQVLFNLVINARDTLLARLARPHDPDWTPRLSVTAGALPPPAHQPRRPGPGRVVDGWVRITVEDNGEGIAPEVIDRIFEPFFTTKETGKGTGLGLATVWHTVTEAGGDVQVDSRPGEGSRFHILLPHAPETAADAGPARADAPGPDPAVPRRRECGRILLAEDEPMVARTTLRLLSQMDFSATHAPDGMAAWELLERNSRAFDVLLLDVNMPRLSGVDLVRRVRRLGYAGRVVMMSGRVAEEDIATLRALGVDYILPKPFLQGDLQTALARDGGVSAADRSGPVGARA
ncbi:MAG: transporter substrate-binding domain-containing protein [Opitutaceae bacterium]|nr:transporter substrate-binding domain-containing protein [Opitutaceae bacterium]